MIIGMGKKIAILVLIHECDEDICHLKNDVQESWIRKSIESDEKLKWNWRLHNVRVLDLKSDETLPTRFSIDSRE